MIKKGFLVYIFLLLGIVSVKAQDAWSNPISVAYLFVKSISTRDSILLNKCIRRQELIKNLTNKYGEDDVLNQETLNTFFFFQYTPWKMRKGWDLNRLSSEFTTESDFKLEIIKKENENLVVNVYWFNQEELQLYIKKYQKSWKVVDLVFPQNKIGMK